LWRCWAAPSRCTARRARARASRCACRMDDGAGQPVTRRGAARRYDDRSSSLSNCPSSPEPLQRVSSGSCVGLRWRSWS
jgi:hypothetical protein